MILPLLTYKMHLNIFLHGWLPISWLWTPLKTEFLFIDNTNNLLKYTKLLFLLSHICQLRCIRLYLDLKTASTITTSTVYSKLNYCNSFYFNLPKSQINCFQLIQNYLAGWRVVVMLLLCCCQSPQILSYLSCTTTCT